MLRFLTSPAAATHGPLVQPSDPVLHLSLPYLASSHDLCVSLRLPRSWSSSSGTVGDKTVVRRWTAGGLTTYRPRSTRATGTFAQKRLILPTIRESHCNTSFHLNNQFHADAIQSAVDLGSDPINNRELTARSIRNRGLCQDGPARSSNQKPENVSAERRQSSASRYQPTGRLQRRFVPFRQRRIIPTLFVLRAPATTGWIFPSRLCLRMRRTDEKRANASLPLASSKPVSARTLVDFTVLTPWVL